MGLTPDNTIPAHLLTRAQRHSGCVAYDPLVATSYGYVPSLLPGIIFSAVFGLSFLVHLGQATSKRKWWYIAFALGAVGECIGWIARTLSHYCPYNKTYFLMQISVLIVAPCFFSAGIYYILSELIRLWGARYSLIPPKLYLWIFIGFDIVSIIVQATGGGLASSASGAIPKKSTAPGTDTMDAGIGVQLFSMTVFVFLFFFTLYRARPSIHGGSAASRPLWTKKLVILIGATSAASTLILARNYYRAVELGQGWDGHLINTQGYFLVLDAALMSITAVLFNIVHPAWFLPTEDDARIKGYTVEEGALPGYGEGKPNASDKMSAYASS